MKKYTELLKDGRWQIRKTEIMMRDNYTCQKCGAKASTGITLNVHHIKYRKGAKPWEYGDDELVTLCEDCHKEEHTPKKSYDLELDLGDFVTFQHSDYDDYGIVYDIDKKDNYAYAVFVDDGAGENSMWFGIIYRKDSMLMIEKYGIFILNDVVLYEEDGYEGNGIVGGYFISLVADFFADVSLVGSYKRYNFCSIGYPKFDYVYEIEKIRKNFNAILDNNETLKKYINNQTQL